MYSFIKGKLVDCQPTQAVVETGGIGYEIELSLRTYDHIKKEVEVKLFTKLIVREDAQILFGFHTQDDKMIFDKLLAVNGVGPNSARLILSSLTPFDIVHAVRMDNDLVFKAVKGIGPKTAKKIILDLKGKLSAFQMAESGHAGKVENMDLKGNTAYDEAFTALTTLGFNKSKIDKVLSGLSIELGEDAKLEEVVKTAIQRLTSG